jgi:hypothetical protein
MQTAFSLAWRDDLIAIGHIGPPTVVKLTDDRHAETSEPNAVNNGNHPSLASTGMLAYDCHVDDIQTHDLIPRPVTHALVQQSPRQTATNGVQHGPT